MAAKQRKNSDAKPKIEVYDVREELRKGAKRTDSWVRQHPWESVGIAALGGAILTKLLFGRRK